MFYYVYILESLKDKELYVGYTTDLIKRFKEHNRGLNFSTKRYIKSRTGLLKGKSMRL